MSTEIRVPTLGESVTEATIAKWMVKTGDSVDAEQILCELETDKVSVEVPAPAAGEIDEIVAKEGETVGVDALLATLSEGAGGGAKRGVRPWREGRPANGVPRSMGLRVAGCGVPGGYASRHPSSPVSGAAAHEVG